MTNKEVIKELSVEYFGDSEKIREAKRMAIKALEQEPCEDVISREAVVDAIADTIVNGESLGYSLAEEIVSEIPSATPKQTDVLDKIRAEIRELKHFPANSEDKLFYNAGLLDALEIIDKYKAEGSDKE